MMTVRLLPTLALLTLPVTAFAQAAPTPGQSRTAGFFIAPTFDGSGLTLEDSDEADSGVGFSATLGYGFNRKLALYFQLSGASMDTIGGTYGLGHFDVGLRAHFRSGKSVVPYVQFGLSSRALAIEVDFDEIEASGAGVAFGGGLNAHFTPAVAFTAGVTWSAGNVGNFKVNGTKVSSESLGMTSARVQFGIVWFPQAK